MTAAVTPEPIPVPTPAVEAIPNGIRQPKRRAFLAAFCATGNISEAARLAKVNRLSHYEWMQDEHYAEVFAQAVEIAGDYLEAVAWNRATNGWLEPVWYQGVQVGSVLKVSDQLLMCLLKAWRPDRFRDNATIRHTGGDGGAIQFKGYDELAVRVMADPALLAAANALAAAAYEQLDEPIAVESEEVDGGE